VKHRINVTIDWNLYIELKRKNIPLSNTVNNLLKNYIDFKEYEDKDYDTITNEILKLEDEKNEIESKKAILQSNLDNIDQERKKEQDKLRRVKYNTMKAHLSDMV